MAVGDDTFCATYRARANIGQIIESDPAQFYADYRRWENPSHPLPDTPEQMQPYFKGAETARKMLEAGDTSANPPQSEGGVRQDHCGYFNAYVAWHQHSLKTYTQKELEDIGISLPGFARGRDVATDFEIALRKYFRDMSLDDYERALVNGTIMVKAALLSTSLGSGHHERRFYVIPGFNALEHERDLTDPLWAGVQNIVDEAFEIIGSRLVNLSGAVQLRLGDKNSTTFNPINVAPGFTIMGGM